MHSSSTRRSRARASLGFPLTLSLTLATAAAWPPDCARAADDAAVQRCHRAVTRGIAAVRHGRTSQVNRCLKSLNYDTCVETGFHTAIDENELRNRVAGAGSPCRIAVESGWVVADFGPTSCPAAWEGCNAEVPSVATLEDVADCLVCQERGLDLEIRHELGLPRPLPSDLDERRCNRRIARLVSTAIRRSVADAAACAKGHTKPFECPVDPGPASRFGRALAKFERGVVRCGLDEGKAPDALALFCNGAIADAAGLTRCLTGLATCVACYTANAALGQQEDCAGLSGFPGCDGTF